MQMFNNATVMIDMMSMLIELIIVLAYLFSKSKSKTKKSMWFMITDVLFLVATATDAIWNIFNQEIHNLYVAKTLAASGVVLGTIGQLFLGIYLFEHVKEKNDLHKAAYVAIGIPCILNILLVLYGATKGKMFVYDLGKIYYGDTVTNALHSVILIGAIQIFIIMLNIKVLSLRSTLIMLSYYILPMIAIFTRIVDRKNDFVYPAIAISLLVINNLLITHEKEDAMASRMIAEEAEKNKSKFLANMSHEIRTPINAVLGLNELILREATEESILGYAHDIKSSGNQLLSLVNDVLDLSKIESGSMDIVPIKYEVSSLLNDVVNMTNIKAEQKGLSFRLDVDSSIPRILVGDEVRLKQIITNILSNAVKYTEEGWVRLSVGYEKIEDFAVVLKFTVEDTGIGMKPEDIERLFVPFKRMEQERNFNIEGTGLGMTITQHFLNMMGSELHVDSIYGNGTIFSFAVRQEVSDWENMGNYKEAFVKLRKKQDTYNVKLKARKARILIVDDMPMNLTVVSGLLKSTEVQIDTATSGEEALELLAYNKFDLLFLDHMMPGLDGIDTLKRLRNDREGLNYKTPAIVLTANAVSGARDLYMDAGFDDYLTKPINPERLEQSLIRYLPKELVELVECSVDEQPVTRNDEEVEDARIEKLRQVAFISVDDGIQAAADVDTYLIAAEEFTLTSKDLISKIRKYYEEEDIQNYTILVHGLKSAARLIGDNDLSAWALDLEMAGKSNDVNRIKNETPGLLNRFEKLREVLEDIFIEKKDESGLDELDRASLKEAIEVIKNALDDFDFDTVASVLEQLDNYRLPQEFKEDYERFKICMAEVNHDEMVEIVNKYI